MWGRKIDKVSIMNDPSVETDGQLVTISQTLFSSKGVLLDESSEVFRVALFFRRQEEASHDSPELPEESPLSVTKVRRDGSPRKRIFSASAGISSPCRLAHSEQCSAGNVIIASNLFTSNRFVLCYCYKIVYFTSSTLLWKTAHTRSLVSCS